jgi:hypothetical protein
MLGQQILHVGHFHAPDLVPMEPLDVRHFSDGPAPALAADVPLEALGESPGIGQPRQGFLLHSAALAAIEPPVFEFQGDASPG